MDQHGRYFFIDTQPSKDVFIVPANPPHEDDYESDHIDEEIEHRLYSIIHHQSDEPANDPINDGISSDHQPTLSSNSNPGNKGKADKYDQDGDNQVTCDSTLLNLNIKRKKKGSSDSPGPSKKVKQSSNSSTPIESPSKSPAEVNQRAPSIIYLSDSDEDTTTEDGSGVLAVKRDLWHVDYKDILISHPVSGKFYRPRIWCSRCRKEGNHPVKLCPLPKHKICYICGSIGHLGQHCQNQHCKRCMDFHPTSSCSLNVREFKCRICNKFGHLDDACPNHWRKYHNITDPRINPDTNTAQILKNNRKSCSICGHRQHYSFECDRLRNRPIEISSPYDTNTTFVGQLVPSRKNKPPTPKKNIFRPTSYYQGTPLTTTKFYGRQSRYFNGESAQPHIDLTNDEIASNNGSVTPNTSPQTPSKNAKKKKKRGRRNNKRSKQQKTSNIEVITTGGPILSGKVKKAKTRQQNRKAKKKTHKMRQLMKQQSGQLNGKRPNLFSYSNMMCANIMG